MASGKSLHFYYRDSEAIPALLEMADKYGISHSRLMTQMAEILVPVFQANIPTERTFTLTVKDGHNRTWKAEVTS